MKQNSLAIIGAVFTALLSTLCCLPAFIFLDEGDNPPLNQLENHPTQSNFYRRTGGTLQTLINSRIQNYLEGYNPF
jgi:hypothetical protein